MNENSIVKKELFDIKNGMVITKGYGNIAEVVMRQGKISQGAKALYSYFISITGNKRSCFPSNKTIMNELPVKSRITLSKYKGELVDFGLLKIEERKNKSGRVTSNNYFPTKLMMGKKEEEESDDDNF